MAEAAHTEIELRHPDDDHSHHSNTVIIRGREITVEGGIYTVVFGGLAILTAIEVFSAEWLKAAIHDAPTMAETLQAVKAILLLAIAIVKSTLVIWFYMHLKDEKRILAVVLLLPLLIAALSVMFLLAIPPIGYSL